MQSVGRTRPLGITIISIILAVAAIISLILVVLGFAVVGLSHVVGIIRGVADVALTIGAIFAILELILAWGLWTLKPWAFWATAIIEALHVLNGLYALFVQHATPFSVFLHLIIPVVILIYLFADRNVRAAFRT